MPSYKMLVTTRNQRKRKALELQTNAPVKKARVSKMKELATMFKTMNRNNDSNRSNYFNSFFIKQKVVYPWLSEETLRWHVRALNSQNKENMITTTTEEESCDNKTKILEPIVIDHNQEACSYEI